MTAAMRRESACANLVQRQRQPGYRFLGSDNLSRRHLCKVLLLQDLAIGNGQPRVDFYFGIFPLTFVQPGKERLLNALRARARRLLRTGSNLWQHRRDQFLDIAALAEEDLEGLL